MPGCSRRPAKSSPWRAASRSRAAYLDWVEEHVKPHVAKNGVDEDGWKSFLERIDYVHLDLGKPEDFKLLRDAVAEHDGTRVFYLATGPSLFVPICRALADVGLNQNARIVLEKPLGYDLESSNAINDAVGEIFPEEQIYRIDHYLGKEPVQNLLALRFGNALSSRSGAANGWRASRSRSRRSSAWKRAAISTTTPAPCATWCRTICCNCFPS